MGSLFYTDAAKLMRDAGLTVDESGVCAGWQSRARSSGGFDAAPLGVAWHHTASSTSPANDLSWMINGSDDAPIGNALIDRQGVVHMIAAGAANTQGKGGPVTFSRGTVPQDKGNTTMWAFEVANNGTGEGWPQAQIDAYFIASNVMNKRFANLPTDLATHAGYCEGSCPGRKVDPARAEAVQGPWKPRSINSSGTWSQDDVRSEASRREASVPPQPPSGGSDEVNWNPDKATVDSCRDAPPVNETLQGKWNDWAVIVFLKTIQEQNGLPITGRYDQATAQVIDKTVAK